MILIEEYRGHAYTIEWWDDTELRMVTYKIFNSNDEMIYQGWCDLVSDAHYDSHHLIDNWKESDYT